MRTWSMVIAAATAAVSVAVAGGCGGDSTTGSGGGGGGTGGGTSNPCDPAKLEKCDVAREVPSACLALVDESKSQTPTLRMAEIKITEPTTLSNALVRSLIDNGVTINLPDCNIGSNAASAMNGNFNWLLQFDLTNKKLKTGGAKPVANPLDGYAFDSGKITQNGSSFDVGPVTVDLTVSSDGKFTAAGNGVDLSVPIYQDKEGKDAIILPLHNAQIGAGTLSDDHGCVGTYDSANLSPNLNCTDQEPYTTGGVLSGYITLEEADKVDVPTAGTNLCAILAGMPTMAKCARTNGEIDFKGNYCSTTNKPGGCADSVQLAASYAASAVKLK